MKETPKSTEFSVLLLLYWCIIRQILPIISKKGGVMNEKFFMGIVLGMIGGAVLATNSSKTRQLVKEGQTEVSKKVEKMIEPKKQSK
jgi:hypothetical protein